MTVQPSTFDCGDGEPWALEYIRKLCRAHEVGRVRGGGEALRAKWQQARGVEDRLVPVLVRRAAGLDDEERAVRPSMECRDDDDDATRLAKSHGWDDHRLVAMRGLATSRGISLERTLRAAMGGDLLSIVELPPVERRAEIATGDEERSDR